MLGCTNNISVELIALAFLVIQVDQEQSSLANFGSGKRVIFICNEELPMVSGDVDGNVQLLIAQRMEQEIVRNKP